MAERAASTRCGEDHVQWSQMPAKVIYLVFTYLPDRDRCRARLACKDWNRVFHTPQLWRQRSFQFRWGARKETAAAARYLQAFGAHLEQMKIEIGQPNADNAKNITLSVETFLDAIEAHDMKLKAFICRGLNFFQTSVYRIARHRARLVRALCAFVQRQTEWLERVDLSCSRMGKEDGARLLKALTLRRGGGPSGNSSAGTSCPLNNLELTDFFTGEMNVVESVPVLLEELGQFVALRYIGLNFTYLSDAMLMSITTKSSRQALETLALYMDVFQLIQIAQMADSNQAVTTAGWQAASGYCPQLRVLVDVRGSFRLVDFRRLLLPGMPLGGIHVTFLGSDDMLPHVASLMEYLSQHYSRTLNVFHLDWLNSMTTCWTYEEAVVKLVRSCPSLRSLSLAAMTVPLNTVLQVASAAKRPCSDGSGPLNVHVMGFERTVEWAALRAELSNIGSSCVVHVHALENRS